MTAAPLRRLRFQALGTVCEVQYVPPANPGGAEDFERRAVAWVERFEAKYSRFRDSSLIARINRGAGVAWVDVDPETEQFFKLCDSIHFLSQGAMDPTALPLIRLWNWKAAPAALPGPEAIAEAKAKVGWQKVRREPGRVFLPEPGMALDFGGFGKEFAVDQVAALAGECGIAVALVDFGRDLRAMGAPPGKPAWHIGLEDPRKPGSAAASIAAPAGRGVASSGDYVRRFIHGGRRFGHIIDPRTGWPVANACLQATVIAPTCLQAGILSTTAFILGVPKGIGLIQGTPNAEGMLVTETARAQTRGFYQYVVS